MAEYRLPTEVRLSFGGDIARGSASETPADAVAAQVSVQVRRNFSFIDAGQLEHLHIFFGSLVGAIQGVDLMLAASYDHDFLMPGVGQLWLPSTLTPVTGSPAELDTTDISIYFDEGGATAGTAMATFKCVAEPEQVQPVQLVQGAASAAVAWQWEIRDDDQPTLV